MNVNELYNGQAFKNYKELCSVLGIEVKASKNSKDAQFREIKRYCDYHTEGHKIFIDDVFEEPKHKIDGRGKSEGSRNNNKIYGDMIQLLLLDLLAQCKNGHVSISRGKLLLTINMINENYNTCGEYINKLSNYTEIEERTIHDFYNTSKQSLKKSVETALNNLMDKRIIWCEIVTKVSEFGSQNTRLATDEEKDLIRDIEKETLDEFKYKRMSDIRVSKSWSRFKKVVKYKLNNNSNINYYFFAYDIRFNEEYLQEERKELFNFILDESARDECKDELNATVYSNIIINAQKRHEKGFNSKWYSKIRLQDNYVDDIKKLAYILINDSHKNILSEVMNAKEKEYDSIDDALEDLFL